MNAVAWWPHTSNTLVASVRLRCMRIIAELECQGIRAGMYTPGRKPPQVLVLSKRYDEKSLRHAVAMRASAGTRLVLDLCDNHFYTSSPDHQWKARADTLRKAVDAVDLVVASTSTLAQYIKDECPGCRQVVVIGDAVEEPFRPTLLHRTRSPLAELQFMKLQHDLSRAKVAEGRRLLWFGNHGSGNAEGGMKDLLLIRKRLERASAQCTLSLTVISNNAEKYRQVTEGWPFNTYYLEWQLTTFSRAAALHDIAVIPVGRNPFTICKTNNRVAASFVHGLAVAADSIPSYVEFSESAVLDDWEQGLDLLMENRSARLARIDSGINWIKDQWSLGQIAAKWAQALELRRYHANATN